MNPREQLEHLFRLATQTSNEHEASAAALAFVRLAVKHEIPVFGASSWAPSPGHCRVCANKLSAGGVCMRCGPCDPDGRPVTTRMPFSPQSSVLVLLRNEDAHRSLLVEESPERTSPWATPSSRTVWQLWPKTNRELWLTVGATLTTLKIDPT